MKFTTTTTTTTITVLLSHISLTTAAATSSAAAECGSLNPMEISLLPAGSNLTAVRKCADHPLGNAKPFDFPENEISLPPNVTVEEKRALVAKEEDACYNAAPYGCSGGYCWRNCGDGGQWCWTAQGDGSGPWITCSDYSQCDTTQSCGKGCLTSSACGCSC